MEWKKEVKRKMEEERNTRRKITLQAIQPNNMFSILLMEFFGFCIYHDGYPILNIMTLSPHYQQQRYCVASF